MFVILYFQFQFLWKKSGIWEKSGKKVGLAETRGFTAFYGVFELYLMVFYTVSHFPSTFIKNYISV